VLRVQKGNVVSSWDMEDSEYCGLIKLDILSLSTLSVLSECRRLINSKRGPETQFDFDELTLDGNEVFEGISDGRTSGIFQFSQRPTTELCKEMGVESFNDMVVVQAIARPGPYKSGMTEEYIKRKHGEGWKTKNRIYEEITFETFGLLVYQEQIMKVISQVAIAYWTAWCKFNYPAEFICSCLTYSQKDEKQSLINEAQDLGLKIMLPKCDISDPIRWTIGEDETLYVPFIEINTIGEQQAIKHCTLETESNVGFFQLKAAPNTKTQVGKLLAEIGAYNPEEMPNQDVVEKNFQWSLSNEESFSTLLSLMGPDDVIGEALTLGGGFSVPSGLIKPIRRFVNPELTQCAWCDLVDECDAPVLPSPGALNAAICGEAPGPKEDKFKRGFHEEAPAGELLWSELALYGLNRRLFYVTNIVKCYPSETGTPKAEHINHCARWLAEEFSRVKPRLILACGNTCVKAFKNQDGGITELSGTTEWIESVAAWVCWCMHPAAVKRKASNRVYFEKGIENFAAKLELLRGA